MGLEIPGEGPLLLYGSVKQSGDEDRSHTAGLTGDPSFLKAVTRLLSALVVGEDSHLSSQPYGLQDWASGRGDDRGNVGGETDHRTILLLLASLILLMNSISQCPEWQRGSMARTEWALETERLRGAICCATGARRSISAWESMEKEATRIVSSGRFTTRKEVAVEPDVFLVHKIHVSCDVQWLRRAPAISVPIWLIMLAVCKAPGIDLPFCEFVWRPRIKFLSSVNTAVFCFRGNSGFIFIFIIYHRGSWHIPGDQSRISFLHFFLILISSRHPSGDLGHPFPLYSRISCSRLSKHSSAVIGPSNQQSCNVKSNGDKCYSLRSFLHRSTLWKSWAGFCLTSWISGYVRWRILIVVLQL